MVYSVLTEPVIPVLLPDGTNASVGIREAFLKAHEIRDIQGDTPLERYALLRLLIAFAMDMLHPKNSFARRDLLEAGQFDAEVFDAYIALCERDGPRFDLFDPDHPFMQSKYDEVHDTDKMIKSVANLLPDLPTGNNHIFINHELENNHALSPARAFRAICVIYLFCFPVGAKEYPSSVNNTPPIYVTVLGKNLFETIIHNMLSISEMGTIPYGLGLVPWRNDCNVTPKKKFPTVSLIEAYTWMPRRITLKCDQDGLVRTMYFQQGHDFKGNALWKDPHVPYKEIEGKYVPVRPIVGRLLWRDIATLTYYTSNENQPFIIYKYIKMMEDEIPEFIPVTMLGLIIKNNAKYVVWYEDRLSIPEGLIKNEEYASLFRNDIEMVEVIQSHLYVSVKNMVDQPLKNDDIKKILKKQIDKPQKENDEKTHEIALQCQQYFLQRAHDLVFGTAMDEICSDMPEKEHVEHFCEAVKRLLQDTLNQVLRASGSDANAMMRQMEAEKWIWSAYKKLTEERMKYYA